MIHESILFTNINTAISETRKRGKWLRKTIPCSPILTKRHKQNNKYILASTSAFVVAFMLHVNCIVGHSDATPPAASWTKPVGPSLLHATDYMPVPAMVSMPLPATTVDSTCQGYPKGLHLNCCQPPMNPRSSRPPVNRCKPPTKPPEGFCCRFPVLLPISLRCNG